MLSYQDFGQSAWQVTQTLIFGYLGVYKRCASNVLKCLGRYPNNDLKRNSLGRTEISEYTPPPMNALFTALPGLVPIFVLAGGVNALAGVLFKIISYELCCND